MYFFAVSYAEMLRFRLKKNLVGPLLGEIGLSAYTETTQNEKFFFKLGKFFKSQMSPLYLLIIVFPTFDPFTATVMALYRKF